jgi:flagellar basal-body rod protein FlgF
MVKGLHTTALGMLPKTLKIDVIANNLANVNTTGFKKSNLFVRELIKADLVGNQSNLSDPFNKIPQTADIDFSQGKLEQTKNPLDLAINGEGFFAVETDNGVKYTRNGNFTLSADGAIVTTDGYKVLGEGGELYIPDPQKIQADQLTVAKNGEIYIGKKLIDKLQVVNFPKDENGKSKLQYAGNNLYSAPNDYSNETSDVRNYEIQQGFLEGSNVNALEEMVNMMQLSSAIQIDQKVIRYQDNSLQQANEVGKVS